MGAGLAAKMAFPPEARRGAVTGIVQQLHGRELSFDCVPLKTELRLLVYGPEKPAKLVIYVHGNSEDIYSSDPFVSGFHKRVFAPDCALVSFDWPGYGRVPGRPSETALVEATQQTLYFCKRHFSLQTSQISLWGRSIGSVGALAVAASNYVAKVLLESPISSAFDAVRSRLPEFMNSFRNCEHVRHFKGAELGIVAGDQDELLEFGANACKLFKVRLADVGAAGSLAGGEIHFEHVSGVSGLWLARGPHTLF